MLSQYLLLTSGPPVLIFPIKNDLVRGIRANGGIIIGARAANGPRSAVTEVLLAECRKSLLLGDSVDIGADDERHQVEEWDPGVLGQELLGKGQADGGGDPADPHDLPETNTDSCPHLVECPGAGN